MLRNEFPFPLKRWPQRLLATLLGEAFLGFLAILAAALTLFPMLFPKTHVGIHTLDLLQWGIIGWFAFEYVFAFACSRAKRAFLLNPWRLLDVVTIVVPLASLLPTFSRALLSSPVLRLVRLVRLVTLGVRASGVVVRGRARLTEEPTTPGPAQVVEIHEGPNAKITAANWDELLAWLKSPEPKWYHVSSPKRDDLARLAPALHVNASFLETHLLGTSYPHFAAAHDRLALFSWLPQLANEGRIDRHGVLFLIGTNSLLSLSRRPTRLLESLNETPAEVEEDPRPYAPRMLEAVLKGILQQNERLVARFEQELRALEDVPVRESQPSFFENTFRVKKDLSTTQSDLWRLKSILADLVHGRVRVPGAGNEKDECFERLSATADYLYDTVVNIREEVLSVIELHLNVVSFDMNRVMRVLAVVSVLGLIPAVVGGLFGMNLADNPWPFTLPQVSFCVFFGMLVTLYFFFVKGWLR
jgi:Mg2+ and Co2+ transporter CorA